MRGGSSSDDINFAGLSCCSYNRTTESACNLVIAARASGNCVKSTKGWDVQGDVLGISCSSRVDASIDPSSARGPRALHAVSAW